MRIENHIHIRHIMLYHFENVWNAAQSFRDHNELIGEGTNHHQQKPNGSQYIFFNDLMLFLRL